VIAARARRMVSFIGCPFSSAAALVSTPPLRRAGFGLQNRLQYPGIVTAVGTAAGAGFGILIAPRNQRLFGPGCSRQAPRAFQLGGQNMNDTEHILAELKNQTALAESARRTNKWSLVFLAIFLFALPVIVYLFGLGQRGRGAPEQALNWYDVKHSAMRLDFDKAIQIGEKLILKTPLDPEAHRRLARAYLAAGDVKNARQHYAEAFRLFPSEENEKLVEAIERRIKANPSLANDAANGSQPISAETN